MQQPKWAHSWRCRPVWTGHPAVAGGGTLLSSGASVPAEQSHPPPAISWTLPCHCPAARSPEVQKITGICWRHSVWRGEAARRDRQTAACRSVCGQWKWNIGSKHHIPPPPGHGCGKSPCGTAWEGQVASALPGMKGTTISGCGNPEEQQGQLETGGLERERTNQLIN